MNLRKLIREEIGRVFKEIDTPNDAIGGTIQNIGDMMQQDIEKMADIIKTQQTSLKNDQAAYKQDMQKKNALSSRIGDVDNAEKKGLERSLPLKDQLNKEKEKQIKDLENTQKAMQTAKNDLDKKNAELAQQSKEVEKSGKTEKTTTSSALPSLPSAI